MSHTHEVTTNLHQLSELLLTTQANARAYFITGQDYYLEKRETAVHELTEVMNHLRQ